jgi:hypothetical protein
MRNKKMNKYEQKRIENASRYLQNINDDGRNGRAFELSCVRIRSSKTEVSKQGQKDISVKMEIDGKIRYVPAECKTNGGRVDDLLSGANKSAFVIYRLQFTQKHKATKTQPERLEYREIPAVIIPTALFLQVLTDCNALKAINHNGEQDGIGIQVSSKKLFDRLTAYVDNYGEAVLFDRNRTYEPWDFEDIDI